MRLLLPLLCFFVLTLASCASAPKTVAPTFAGTWDVLVKGTPLGDVEGQLVLTGVQEKLEGRFVAGTSSYTLNSVEKTEDGLKISFYYSDQGIDVDMVLKGAPADASLVGNTLGEYITTAVRVTPNADE